MEGWGPIVIIVPAALLLFACVALVLGVAGRRRGSAADDAAELDGLLGPDRAEGLRRLDVLRRAGLL